MVSVSLILQKIPTVYIIRRNQIYSEMQVVTVVLAQIMLIFLLIYATVTLYFQLLLHQMLEIYILGEEYTRYVTNLLKL